MRYSLNVPEVGAGDEPLYLCGWLVDLGDLVLAGDLVAEILIPGVTFEIVSDATGRLVEIVKPVDSRVHQGDVIGWIESRESESASTNADG
jgi:pyruvate/2-oxoglutarate dehydrogenase complex dihydrolipoamide acyltransferase (E2) component